MINLITIPLLVIVTVVLFRLVRLLRVRSKLVQQLIPVLSAAELFIWTFLIFWIVTALFRDKSYYNALIIILVLAFTLLLIWFYVKDIIAGFIVRIRHNPQTGQRIATNDWKGLIRHLGISQLTVELESGSRKRIPYSQLVTQALTLEFPHRTNINEVSLEIKVMDTGSIRQLERKVIRVLAQSAWCLASKPIRVSTVDPKTLSISFSIADKTYLPLISTLLQKEVESSK